VVSLLISELSKSVLMSGEMNYVRLGRRRRDKFVSPDIKIHLLRSLSGL
jgi:hypothetical protein